MVHDPRLHTDHRVRNHADWSPLARSRARLGHIVAAFIDADAPLLLVLDDTLDRRYGRRVADKARYHDPVRSATGHVVTTSGVRWRYACALVRVPWSRRRALPHPRRQRVARQAPAHRPSAGGGAEPPHPPLATHSTAHGDGLQRLRGRALARTCRAQGAMLVARLSLEADLTRPSRSRPPRSDRCRSGQRPSTRVPASCGLHLPPYPRGGSPTIVRRAGPPAGSGDIPVAWYCHDRVSGSTRMAGAAASTACRVDWRRHPWSLPGWLTPSGLPRSGVGGCGRRSCRHQA